MQILEVKNNIAKIIYNPAENKLLPSDFLLIEDSEQKLIAQVINIESTDEEDCNLAFLRLALNIDKEDNLSYFNGYIPARNSKLIYITPDEIIELIKGAEENIYFGNLSNHTSCFVKTNMSFVNDGLYIQSDRDDKTQIIFKNLISELKNKDKKIIIIDFNGQYSNASNVLKLKISENIKLPLNIEAFDTILKHDVVDCPIEDVAVIQSIVLELREYLKVLKDKYIPFNMFKKVVDEEFATNPVSGLMLLRNKLWLYAQDGIFADFKDQYDVINSQFFNHNIIIVDASDIAEKWHKFIIQTVKDLTTHDCYMFLSLNDIDIDKKSILSLYNKQNIVPVITTTYDSPYRGILKSVCKNQLLCKPSSDVVEQEFYTPLLNRMNNGDFLLYGETTLYMPLQLELQQFNSETVEEVVQNDIKRDVDKLLSSPQTVIPTALSVVSDVQDEIIEEVEEVNVKNSQPLEENQEAQDGLIDAFDDEITDSDYDFLDEIEPAERNEQQPPVEDDILNVPFDIPRIDDIDRTNASAYGVFEPLENTNNAKPIPKVQVDSIMEEILEVTSEQALEEQDLSDMKDSEISENNSDVLVQVEEVLNEELVDEQEGSASEELTSIDEVIDDITTKIEEKQQNDSSENSEKEHSKSVKKEEKELVVELVDDTEEESNPPLVNENIVVNEEKPMSIYETDVPKGILSNDVPFKVDDRVYHPKYGVGTIEAFFNYSNKILFCRIYFDEVGLRMLDPRISGLEKVS